METNRVPDRYDLEVERLSASEYSEKELFDIWARSGSPLFARLIEITVNYNKDICHCPTEMIYLNSAKIVDDKYPGLRDEIRQLNLPDPLLTNTVSIDLLPKFAEAQRIIDRYAGSRD